MKRGKKVYAVINGEIKEGVYGQPMCLIYLKNSDGSRTRFVSKVYTSRKDAEKGENAVSFESVKPVKKHWYDALLTLLMGDIR